MASVGNTSNQVNVQELQNKINTLENKVKTLETEKNEPQKAIQISKDKISTGEVKKGFIPGVEGLLAGAGIGAVAGGGGTLLYGAVTNGLKGEGGLGVVLGMVVLGAAGAVAGGITGAVVTQTTANHGKGALIGAGIGAVLGGIGVGLQSGNLFGAGMGALAGGVAGAGSGFVASHITKTK
jgi:hypothetical protein